MCFFLSFHCILLHKFFRLKFVNVKWWCRQMRCVCVCAGVKKIFAHFVVVSILIVVYCYNFRLDNSMHANDNLWLCLLVDVCVCRCACGVSVFCCETMKSRALVQEILLEFKFVCVCDQRKIYRKWTAAAAAENKRWHALRVRNWNGNEHYAWVNR